MMFFESFAFFSIASYYIPVNKVRNDQYLLIPDVVSHLLERLRTAEPFLQYGSLHNIFLTVVFCY